MGDHGISATEVMAAIQPLVRGARKRRTQTWQSLPIKAIINIQRTILVWERADAMPTRNINLTAELDRFVATKVKSGRYENASEVVRAGLRNLEREERQYELKLAALGAAIDEGDASGVAQGNVFRRVRKNLKLPLAR
jgi:antitoxin ParD1/3/4